MTRHCLKKKTFSVIQMTEETPQYSLVTEIRKLREIQKTFKKNQVNDCAVLIVWPSHQDQYFGAVQTCQA